MGAGDLLAHPCSPSGKTNLKWVFWQILERYIVFAVFLRPIIYRRIEALNMGKTNKRYVKLIVLSFLSLILIANVAAADRYINWCGKQWWVKSGTGNPGCNTWNSSSSNVWVDGNNGLHLTIKKVGNTWYSTEVDTTTANYFYGVYKWNVSSPVLNLDPNIVAAMFFRHNDTNEIDIEATQWGMNTFDRLSLSVQPNAYRSVIAYNSPDRCATNVTYSFDWEPKYIHFTAKLANGTVIADWNCTDQTSIPHATGGVAMQMWLMNHLAPTNKKNAEMILTSFSYTPS
jgi:endo-1,3-1,4-beta-glycanase ExoK